MGPLDPTSTPSRIPRPTFMAASPRTPSIRAVPYSHMDRVNTTSSATGSYSPSSWPFPKSDKPSSLTLSTSDHANDARDADSENMDRAETNRAGHRATASASSTITMTPSLYQKIRERSTGRPARADVCRDSVGTQIYSPKNGEKPEPDERSHHRDDPRGAFLAPAADMLERPMTPTPYSILRKVSEMTEPETEDEGGHRGKEQPTCESRQPSVIHSPQTSEPATQPEGRSVNENNVRKTTPDSAARTTPVMRDEEGRVLSRLHPLPVASSPSDETANHPYYIVATSSVQAEHGSSDGGTATTNAPEGIIILRPAERTGTAVNIGTSARNTASLYSPRPTTIQSEIPDLESLRLGPRLRHSRLPPSTSMAANAGRGVPSSTKELWSALGRSRRMMLTSAVVLELSILNAVSSITAVVVTNIEQGYASTGLVAWAAVSGALVGVFGGLLGVAFLQYRKMNEDLVSGENWIEMHLRSRPLPPRPQSQERKHEDNGVTEAWQKFVQDHEQLRRYVEFLESRIGVLGEGRPNAAQHNNGASKADDTGNHAAGGNTDNSASQTLRGRNTGGDTGNETPKPKPLSASGSLSRRQLLQPEPWQHSESEAALPKSDTKASILTELCEAVTEGYSPLSEQMPRGSPRTPQDPNVHTPSARSRNTTLRHFVLAGRDAGHQSDVGSDDALKRKKEGI